MLWSAGVAVVFGLPLWLLLLLYAVYFVQLPEVAACFSGCFKLVCCWLLLLVCS